MGTKVLLVPLGRIASVDQIEGYTTQFKGGSQMAKKTVKAADQFSQWLLKQLQGYKSILHFINQHYPMEKQRSAYSYLSCVIRTDYTMGKRFFDEFCRILHISESEKLHGLELLADRKIARRASRLKPPLEYLPTALFCVLSKLPDKKITPDDIINIAEVLSRLGEEYINEIVIEQIVVKYFNKRDEDTKLEDVQKFPT